MEEIFCSILSIDLIANEFCNPVIYVSTHPGFSTFFHKRLLGNGIKATWFTKCSAMSCGKKKCDYCWKILFWKGCFPLWLLQLTIALHKFCDDQIWNASQVSQFTTNTIISYYINWLLVWCHYSLLWYIPGICIHIVCCWPDTHVILGLYTN